LKLFRFIPIGTRGGWKYVRIQLVSAGLFFFFLIVGAELRQIGHEHSGYSSQSLYQAWEHSSNSLAIFFSNATRPEEPTRGNVFHPPLVPIGINLNNFKQIVISSPKIYPGNENLPLLTSCTFSQPLCQYVLLRGLRAHITDTMSYNCSFETAAR